MLLLASLLLLQAVTPIAGARPILSLLFLFILCGCCSGFCDRCWTLVHCMYRHLALSAAMLDGAERFNSSCASVTLNWSVMLHLHWYPQEAVLLIVLWSLYVVSHGNEFWKVEPGDLMDEDRLSLIVGTVLQTVILHS